MSTLFLSQLPVASWYGVIGDSTIADAVMDRIMYGSIRIELKGDSFRKKLNQDQLAKPATLKYTFTG